jgi:T-complex protein 1 subunit gamma
MVVLRVADLAQHYLVKAGISVIRRLRKTDNDRIARAVGATIVHEPSELTEKDVGTQCGLFEIRKIGDEYFTFLVECKDPKACTVMLRGGSKDVLNELERNLQDAMAVARNILLDPRIVPGGGAVEMAVGKVRPGLGLAPSLPPACRLPPCIRHLPSVARHSPSHERV